MPQVEFVGQSAQDSDNIAANPSRLINCYREPVASGSRTQHVIKSVPGDESLVTLSSALLREMATINGEIYAAAGGAFYLISAMGGATSLGSVADDPATTIAGNFGKATIVSGGKYHVLSGASITLPTLGAFADVGSVAYIGGYSVVTEKNGRRFAWSDLADAETMPALNFQTADSRDDKNIRAVAQGGRLHIFKERSIETWYVTGQAGTEVFARVAGGTIDTGLKALRLLVKFPGGVFFVGDDGIAYIYSGASLQPISIPAVETAIKNHEATDCLTYEDEGHKFLCIRFNDHPAFCYDLSTGEWHERADGALLESWGAVASAEKDGQWYVGRIDGSIAKVTRNNTSVTGPLVRKMISRTLYMDGRRFRVPELEVFGRVGLSDLGRDAQCWIRTSGDDGLTWSPEKWRGLGGRGEYRSRALWRALGQFRQLTVELNLSDPADISINATARLRVA